jgi:flagellar FliJ protein
MPQFKFKLQKVLDYRKIKEEEKKRELSLLLIEYNKEREILNILKNKQEELFGDLKNLQKDELNITQILFYYFYLQDLSNRIKKQVQILEELDKKIQEKREEVIQASKERRIMEKLKERKYKEFLYFMDRAEQIFLDEISNSAFVRNKKENAS